MAGKPVARQIAAAARRLLERGGAEAVTMRQVARAVGITPMAIYRHFPDRSALLNSLANEGFEELAALLSGRRPGGSVENRLLNMFEIFLEHALAHPRLFELMFLKPRAGARRYPPDFKAGKSPTAGLIVKVIEEGMHRRRFRRDDAWEVAFELGALSHGLIALYLGGRVEATPARFRALYLRSFRRYVTGIRS